MYDECGSSATSEANSEHNQVTPASTARTREPDSFVGRRHAVPRQFRRIRRRPIFRDSNYAKPSGFCPERLSSSALCPASTVGTSISGREERKRGSKAKKKKEMWTLVR